MQFPVLDSACRLQAMQHFQMIKRCCQACESRKCVVTDMLVNLTSGSKVAQVSAYFCAAAQEAVQDPGDGPRRLASSWSGIMAATQQGAPAQPQAGVAPAPAAASGRGLGRAASLTSLSAAAAASAELEQPAPRTLGTPATPWGQSFPRSHRASHYGPSQVVPAPAEESQPPDSRRPLLGVQPRQHAAQATPSLASSILSWVAVIGNRRILPEQQQQSAAGSATGQEELEAAPRGTSMRGVPIQPQPEVPERPESPTEAASRGMAAATGSEGGDGPGSAHPMRGGSR